MEKTDRTTFDNVMEYWLFPSYLSTIKTDDKFDLVAEYFSLLKNDLLGYIWQRDPLNLMVKLLGDGELFLYGKTDYGDNVEDLWFIVYLLKKLSAIVDGLVIKVCDNDGEFLLIEAADELPKWLEPEAAENRVYIYNGKLHIIPIAKSPADITLVPSGKPLLQTAVECVRKYSKITEASQPIQNAIEKRVGKYPEWAKKNLHSTTLYLPVNAAKLLSDRPQLVADAVRAFYLRDPLDLKACQDMKYFSPDVRVMMKVNMTRCLYAQLMQQQFFPPKRSQWQLPPANHPNYKAHDLGMKLAFGFEILCVNACADKDKSATFSANWQVFQKSLESKGYFQGEIKGSLKYKKLLAEAQVFYQSSSVQENTESSQKRSQNDLINLIKTSSVSLEELEKSEKTLTPDDDDQWLFVTTEDINDILEEITGKKPSFQVDSVAEGVKSFMDKQSDVISGAEFPSSNEKISFDSQGFLASIERMMNGEEGELESDGGSSLDDYDTDESIEGNMNEAINAQTKSTEPEIEDFMQMMDRELAKTNIGKSFEKSKSSKKQTELSEKQKNTAPLSGVGRAPVVEEEDLSDEEGPVDVDLNTVKNMLESYSNQMGLPGPASNLLESMGIQLPQNSDT